MDFFTIFIIASALLFVLKKKEQNRNTRLLAQHLGQFQIDKHMGSLMEGYMRAMGESDLQRRAQIWTVLDSTENSLVSQFQRFATEFAKEPAERTRVSTLPLALPYMDVLVPSATVDFRAIMHMHAQALAAVKVNEGQSDEERSRRAFTMTAELMLMQHSCHWFCKNRTVASMRLIARHKTPYEQVLKAISPATLKTYEQLTNTQYKL